MRRQLLAIALVGLLAGCYGSSSSPTPGDMTDVQGELEAHGMVITDAVAGDAGCADPTLHDNARRLTVTAADGQAYQIYLFNWYKDADFLAAAGAFDACVAAFAASGNALVVETVEVSPWRAYGPGWTRALRDAVQQSLEAAASGQ
jgi:hypothetical protein